MKRILLLLLAALFVLGCVRQPDETPIAEASAAPEQVDAITLVTPSPTPEPTATPKATEAPTPEPTPEPTATPEPTPTPAPFVPLMLPDSMRVRNGYTGSSFTGIVRRNADGAYFAYGSVGETEPCFYPCDENGTVAPGETPVSNSFILPAYTPAEPPKADGEKLLVVYLNTQCVVAYEGEEGDWKELRVMICSTGRQKHETPTGTYRITDRYTYKMLGTTEESHCYGFWASRFKTHHLFHSVPINYDAGRDQEKAHRMCDMHKFEKLGTVASDGCVRMTVADAKWIYEFSETGRVTVKIINAAGPTPEKPPAVIWEEPYTDKHGYGWDPTDPDPKNPYHFLATSAPEAADEP